jgi:hypothetical protein
MGRISQEENPRAVCKKCRAFVKRADGSTSLIKSHLKNYHPDQSNEYHKMVTNGKP